MINGKKVVVVGGAGFIGSHMTEHLIDLECEVLVLDNLSTGERGFVHEEAKFLHCDITHSESELIKIFKDFKPAVVYNYAAYPYIPVSFSRPVHVFQINALGAMNVINAAHEAGAEKIVQISSAEVYGESIGKISETDRTIPHSTYGASKLAIDYYVQSAWKERRTPVMAVRQFNCAGPRETHPYVIPEIVKQIAEWDWSGDELPKPVVFLGNNSKRDFMDVEDAVKVHSLLPYNGGKEGEVYNLGSGKQISIFELAKMVYREVLIHKGFENDNTEDGIEIVTDKEKVRPWEIWSLMSDNTRICLHLGKKEEDLIKTPLEITLRKVVNDYFDYGFAWEDR